MVEYFKPSSVEEACSLLDRFKEGALILAGGTDVVLDIRYNGLRPRCLISISNLEGLKYIRGDENGIRIGAATTIAALAKHPLTTRGCFNVIAEAARCFGSPQIRNRATVGGNICRAGCSDIAVPLLALDATVNLVSIRGERTVPLSRFFAGGGRTVRAPDELVKEVAVNNPPPLSGSAYIRFSYRRSLDLPIIGICSYLALDSDLSRVVDARIAMNAVAPTPIRLKNTESSLMGKEASDHLIDEAAKIAAEEIQPRADSYRASPSYRRALAYVLTKQCLMKALAAAREKRLS